MASEWALQQRAIKPPSARLVAQSTFVHRETLQRQAKWRADDLTARKGRPKYEPGKFLMLTVDLDRADKRDVQVFRARKREWKSGVGRVIAKMFGGLQALNW